MSEDVLWTTIYSDEEIQLLDELEQMCPEDKKHLDELLQEVEDE